MSIVHLTPKASQRTPKTMGYKKRDFSNKAGRRKELFFGLAVTAIILGSFTLAAFNGGLSVEAGKLAMTIDASWSQGMQLNFAAI